MNDLFSQVLNMSFTGGIVILIVLIVRFALRKYPKIYSHLLWAVVLFRLLCPLSIPSPISLLDAFEPEVTEVSRTINVVSYIPEEAIPSPEPEYSYFAPSVSQVENILEYERARDVPPMTVVVPYIWLAGICILVLISLIQYLQLRFKLVGCVLVRKNVYLTDQLDTAFVLGIVRPRIFLPAGVPLQERKYIIAHEKHHIYRGDHIFKLLGFGALCIHWFNPLVWVAFVLAGKDMEMSCDEAVIQKMGPEIRADYSQALLKLTVHRQVVPGMPLAFGEGDTKGRVENMARWKKPRILASLVCVLVCIAVLAACALNPAQKEGDTSHDIHLGEVAFSLPKGFTGEETANGLFIKKDGMVAGGLYELEYPEQEFRTDWEWAQALDIPEAITGAQTMLNVHYTSDGDAFSKIWLDYGTNGIEEVYHYLMEGADYIYDLWFDMRVMTETEKTLVLNAANGKSSSVPTSPYELSNALIPVNPHELNQRIEKNGDLSLVDFSDEDKPVGGIKVKVAPEGFQRTDYFSQEFMIALGIGEASDESLGYSGGGNSIEMDFEYFSDVPPGQERSVHTRHKFFVTRDDYIIDVWIDLLAAEESTWIWMMDALDIPEVKRIRGESQQAYQETIPAEQTASLPFEITGLPEGYTSDILGSNCVLFINGNNIVGGVDVFTIPEGVYDPVDTSWFWLEKMGMSDFENPELCYIGGMTSGDHGWHAEFASDVPDGTPKTVHRCHIYRVVGNQLCDIWLDMLLLDNKQAGDIANAVSFGNQIPAPPQGNTQENVAFEKTAAIMEAVSNGSCHIVSVQENDGNEGPKGYKKNFLYHEGNYLYTSQVLTEGENLNEAGDYYSRYGLLIVDDAFYSNAGFQGNPDELIWEETDPVDPEVPWLGNRIWNKSFATYMDTLTDENGTAYMFRYDKPFEDREDFSDCYFVSFNFSPQGEFLNVKLQVNLFQENAFTITESIQSMDESHIENIIEAEYMAAVS